MKCTYSNLVTFSPNPKGRVKKKSIMENSILGGEGGGVREGHFPYHHGKKVNSRF